MKLLRETLVNFKGIRDYTFSPQAESVSVSGDNGSGKTSLLDGFLWVHIPAYPDSESGFIRTRYRQHPDSNPEASGHLSGDSIVL